MSKVVTLNVARSQIYESVERLTEYVGEKAGAYKDKSAFEENEDILDQFCSDGLNAIRTALKDFEGQTIKTDEQYLFHLRLDDNWDMNQSEVVSDLIRDALEDYVTSKWLAMVGEAEMSKDRMAEYSSAIAWIIQLMWVKSRPALSFED